MEKFHLIMGITSTIGAIYRLAYEWDKNGKIKISKIMLVFFGAFLLSYIAITYGVYAQKLSIELTGIVGALSGVLSLDIISFFINNVPELIRGFLEKVYNMSVKEKEEESKDDTEYE